MVSFSCENCGDVLTKKKLDPHRNSCRGATFTCLDCMVHFWGVEYRTHTSCISEAQKYQGSLYKDKKGRKPSQSQSQSQTESQDTSAMNGTKGGSKQSSALVGRKVVFSESEMSSSVAIVDAPPEVPEAPKAINVFDYLVTTGGEDDWESDGDDDDNEYDQDTSYKEHGFAYGSGPVPTALHRFNSHTDLRKGRDVETPVSKSDHSRNMSVDSASTKKSSKRKRGHPEGLDLSKKDVDMTDVPPNLHSGLTGGINRLLSQNGLPPSPDLSGDAISPQSPLKRSRVERDSTKRIRRRSNSDEEDRRKKPASASSKHVVKRDRAGKAVMQSRRSTRRSSPTPQSKDVAALDKPKKQLAIEYTPSSPPKEDTSRALVRIEHAPTTKSVDMFLTCLARGSETDEGVSLWRALKRWRKDGGSGEKELWKRLKIRANEEGDLVLCV